MLVLELWWCYILSAYPGERLTSCVHLIKCLSALLLLQANDLQKKAAEVKTLLESNCQLADSLVGDKMDKKDYIKAEKENQAKITRLQSEIDSVITTF